MIKIDKRKMIYYFFVVCISLSVVIIKNPTYALLIAIFQLVMILSLAKVSFLSIFSGLINFCLLQQYSAYRGWDVYGLLAYNIVPIYYYELVYCSYIFNLIVLLLLFFTSYIENEEKIFCTNTINMAYPLNVLLLGGAVLITILIFPSIPSLSAFTTNNRFSSGILPFAGWSCIPAFFFAICIMNKKLKKITVLATIFVLLWFFFHGERVDGIGLLSFLAIKYYYNNKNNRTTIIKLGIVAICAAGLLVTIGMFRTGVSEVGLENIITKILVQETACDVTHVFNCAVDLWKNGNQYNGITYISYLVNCIPLLEDPYLFQRYIHNYYYTAGGGLFFAEIVGNFGIYFVGIFTLLYMLGMHLLIRKSSKYRFLIYTALTISIFRTAWYGLNYPIITILYFVPFILMVNRLFKNKNYNI